ncbi:MAG: phosphoribosylaminoimidazole-succinocarboxamide synthase [Ignavibacteriales bacterium]
MKESVILNSKIEGLEIHRQGKVRDVYESGDYYLIVSTDRLSAFDVVMNQGIPFKGKILNSMAVFWFEMTKDITENHLITADVDKIEMIPPRQKDEYRGRVMLVRKARVVPVECIVRGYLAGTGWNDYRKSGEICGHTLPEGLVESSKLPAPIFTPSTKAEIGEHDENISIGEAVDRFGSQLIDELQHKSLAIYNRASEYAHSRGIIIADTKFEFGFNEKGELLLIDEALTPDSSRFWLEKDYHPGRMQTNFDKQFVRDFLLSINFNKQPPAPDLPDEVIQKTTHLYKEAYKLLTGSTIDG